MNKTRVKTGRLGLAVWLVAVTVLLLPTFSRAASDNDGAAVVTVGYQKSGSLILLKSTGLLDTRLQALGVKVNWAEFHSGPPMMEALNAGKIDIGSVGETPPVFAQAAEGTSIRYVANEPAAPKGQGLLTTKATDIKRIADLKGKKVAVAKGTSSHYFLVKALASVGLTLHDIVPTYLSPADAKAALERGDVAAWAIWDYHYALAELKNDFHPIIDGAGLVNNYQFYIARDTFVEQSPAVLRVVLDELDKIEKWAESNPTAAAKSLADATGVEAAVFERAFLRRSGFGVNALTPEVIDAQQRLADTFFGLGLIPKNITVKNAVWQP